MRRILFSAALLLAAICSASAQQGGGLVTAVGQGAWQSVTPTVTSGSAYANGNCIGGLQTIQLTPPGSGIGVPNGDVILQEVTLTDASKQAAVINLFIFDQKPTNSTFTDKAACSIAAADYGKIVDIVAISTYVQDGGSTVSVAAVRQLGIPLNLGGGTSFYAVAMSNSATPTYTSTAALSFKYSVVY